MEFAGRCGVCVGSAQMCVALAAPAQHLPLCCANHRRCPVPRSPAADGYVRVYRFLDEGKRIELVHKTQVCYWVHFCISKECC